MKALYGARRTRERLHSQQSSLYAHEKVAPLADFLRKTAGFPDAEFYPINSQEKHVQPDVAILPMVHDNKIMNQKLTHF